MTDKVKKRLDKTLKKQKALLRKHIDNPSEIAFVCGTWSGFLAGMKLTGAISYGEYACYYNELICNVKRIEKISIGGNR